MPSSISSSEQPRGATSRQRRLGGIWATAILLALLTLAAVEAHWRRLGFQAEIRDSKQLWSMQRARVYGSDPLPVVFIGASRSAYGIDIARWHERYPQTRPLMLSVNGHHPMATLRDLASDEGFQGLVVCDVNSEGLWIRYRDMQQPWVDFYHQRWTPNWHAHRLLLNLWQRISVLGNPELAWKPVMRRWLAGQADELPVPKIDAERSGLVRFERIPDLAGFARWFEQGNAEKMREARPDASDYIDDLADVVDWVHAIQARGGQVVFFQPPVAGTLRDLEFHYFERARYWDAFAALPGIHAIQGMDIPAIRQLPLPDLSHVKGSDRARLTDELAKEIERRGLITPAGKLLPEDQVRQSPPPDPLPPFRLPQEPPPPVP
jgi:hypothetical protein